MKIIIKFFAWQIVLLTFLTSCASYRQFQYMSEEFDMPTEVFNSTYNQTWQAVLQVMKKYELGLQNQEAGIIKTRWIDNTMELNFADSFGGSDSVKASKFKVIVNVVKGFKGTREVSKVSVFKRQLVEQDFLQGWKEMPTDGILENTILYRIKRKILIDDKLREIEEKRSKEIESKF